MRMDGVARCRPEHDLKCSPMAPFLVLFYQKLAEDRILHDSEL